MPPTKKSRGFTLIELLVVISIIALLASIVFSSVSTAQANSRDARRQEDLSSLMQAFDLYATSNGGNYPAINILTCLGLPGTSSCWTGFLNNGGPPASFPTGNISLNSNLTPYISSIPQDPEPSRGVGNSYLYYQGTISYNGCSGSSATGSFIVYEMENSMTNGATDSACKYGGAHASGCCAPSPFGCTQMSLCFVQLQ
ncbi:MAG TPA: type II secretion system protein [Candidatus Paceibacterota bacterium]|nr:type II secretion system protein [Candidatus Paceibacterota bacterium]